jgi:hypothetical protein
VPRQIKKINLLMTPSVKSELKTGGHFIRSLFSPRVFVSLVPTRHVEAGNDAKTLLKATAAMSEQGGRGCLLGWTMEWREDLVEGNGDGGNVKAKGEGGCLLGWTVEWRKCLVEGNSDGGNVRAGGGGGEGREGACLLGWKVALEME